MRSISAGRRHAAFEAQEGGEDGDANAHHAPQPGRPADIMAEQQRADQAQQAGEQDQAANDIEPRAGAPRQRRHDARGGRNDDDPKRHVDKEHRAPASIGEVDRHEETAEQKARRTRKPEHDAVDAEGAAALLIGEQEMQGCQHLRHHQRCGRTLRKPRQDQFEAGLREPAPQRGQREAGDACQKQVPRAMDVAKPATRDHQRRIGDQIDRDDGFDLGRRRMQVDRDGRNGDVDHKGVDAEHELGCHHDRQHPPAAGRIHSARNQLMHKAIPCHSSSLTG